MTTDLDSTHAAAVDHGYHWQPMATCPRGSKIQLLTKYGCAIYGTWTGKETIYDGWAPLPTRAAKGEAGADYINQKGA